jgi:glutamate racemase
VREIAKIAPGLEVIQKSCPLFVPIVEEGRHLWESEIARMTAHMYLKEMRARKPAALILGCTHYPLLGKTIQEVMGPGVKLIDSAQNAALRLQDILSDGLRNKSRMEGVIELYTSDSVEKFLPMGRQILGADNLRAERVDIEKY